MRKERRCGEKKTDMLRFTEPINFKIWTALDIVKDNRECGFGTKSMALVQ
jgi:hypothetical protein